MTDVALVTGASRGIGSGIARELARRGLEVVVHYNKSEAEARAMAEELSRSGARATIFPADLTNVDQVRALIRHVKQEHGRLDVLVNNAGVLYEGAFALTAVDRFWDVMHTNVGAVVGACKCALPLMVTHKRGRIVNVASIAAMHCPAGLSAYSASKAAIIALSKTLARELASVGIAVNVVAPGFIDTEMSAGMQSPEARTARLAAQPVQRIGTVEEVAALVGFLATEAPSYMTGDVLRIDGGAMIG